MIYRLLYKVLYDGADIRHRVSTRIYARRAPQDVSGEHIILGMVGGEAHNHLLNEAGTGERVIQVSWFADSAVESESGFELVRMRLSGFSDAIEILDPLGVPREYSLQANLLSPGDLVNPPQDASDRWAHQHSGDFQVFFEQDVPTHA